MSSSLPVGAEFTGVAFDGKKVSLTYQVTHGEDAQSGKLVSTEPPHPDLPLALRALLGWVVTVCELPRGYADKIEVRGLTISKHPATSEIGCVVKAVAKVALTNSPFNIATPIAWSVAGEQLDMGGLPDDVLAQIAKVQDEARAFVLGKRAQTELDMGDDDASHS